MTVHQFRRTVWKYYKKHKRDLLWRKTRDPYKILVSEIMLQQTQVERVIPKYRSFLKQFPNFKTLAKAPLHDVLKVWQGLGYNRRAVSLHRLAGIVMREYKGTLPKATELLIELPGIGRYTAEAVRSFAWNLPGFCLETNIRTAFIHAFFPKSKNVNDKKLESLVLKALDKKNPREWYWALMDYGAMIKHEHGNFSRQSKHYAKQSRFEGSFRQIRSAVLKTILKDPIKLPELVKQVKKDHVLIEKALQALIKEGAVRVQNGKCAV